MSSEEQLFRDLADGWRNASLQMNALCAAQGAKYYHFLQPNQYVPDSKPMESGEANKTVRAGHPYQKGGLHGYPELSRAGQELRRQGVSFTSLVDIFEHEQRPVYVDDCCHVNQLGYEIVARRIYDTIYRN